MNTLKILCIEDNKELSGLIEEYLEHNNHNVTTCGNLSDAKECMQSKEFDVVLLDLTLPDGEGLTLIPQIKSVCHASIIVVSGKSDTTEKIVCLEMGADDYVTKPFEMRELSARIKAVARRSETDPDSAHIRMQSSRTNVEPENDNDIITFANDHWHLNRSQYQLFDKNGQSAELTTGEFQLLEAMVLSPNRALSRERLFELTNRDGDYDAYDRAIDIQIGRLRKKIGDTDQSSQIIKTVRNIGYMFTG